MKNSPLISIITVVYNGERYLEETIKSVMAQTYPYVEYIVIDGGSTDGTLGIIERYEDQISKWVSESDKGLYDAMNKGIRMASGEIIGMINSDDTYEPEAVQIVVDAFQRYPDKRIFHGDRNDISEDGTVKVKPFNSSKFKFIYYGMTYNHPSMFVHRDIYQNQLYNTGLRVFSDYEFVLKNLEKHPDVFHYIPRSYVNYRLDGLSGNMSTRQLLQEGFKARKNGGLTAFQNYFSWILRWSVRKATAFSR